jgi:hypothetical protein
VVGEDVLLRLGGWLPWDWLFVRFWLLLPRPKALLLHEICQCFTFRSDAWWPQDGQQSVPREGMASKAVKKRILCASRVQAVDSLQMFSSRVLKLSEPMCLMQCRHWCVEVDVGRWA